MYLGGEIMSQENDTKLVYSHQSKVHCKQCKSFEVKAVKTICRGRVKVWKCKKCNTIIKTVGQELKAV